MKPDLKEGEIKIFPRSGSVEYKFLLSDKQNQAKLLKTWKKLNKFFTVPLYRINILPLFGLGRIFLLLYTKGRRTGRARITPVEYRKKDGVVHVVAARGSKAHWFKNMKSNPDDINIKISFKKYPIRFEIINDINEKNELFVWYVSNFPKSAKTLFGWDPKKDNPQTTDFTTFSKLVEVVKLYPK